MAGKGKPGPGGWPEETKAIAVQIAVERGLKAAAAETGCAVGSVRRWCKQLAVEPNRRVDRAKTAVDAGQRREAGRERGVDAAQELAREITGGFIELQPRLQELALRSVDRACELVGDERDMRSVVGAFTRAVHDLAVLAAHAERVGGGGEGTGHGAPSEPERLDEVITDLVRSRAVPGNRASGG